MNVLKASLSSRISSYKSWPIIFFDNPDRLYQSWLKPRTTEHSGDLVFYSKRRRFGEKIFAGSGDLQEIVGHPRRGHPSLHSFTSGFVNLVYVLQSRRIGAV